MLTIPSPRVAAKPRIEGQLHRMVDGREARDLSSVMAGLVPAIHVLPHRGASREGPRRRPRVDARNESGHDDERGGAVGRSHRPPVCPGRHPGLVPGSSLSGTALVRPPPDRGPRQAWTPAQGRGDSGGPVPGMTTRGRMAFPSSIRASRTGRSSTYPYKPLSKGSRPAGRQGAYASTAFSGPDGVAAVRIGRPALSPAGRGRG